ncbi:uncharacterized protein LOC142985623 [Anticarsia gemmatalis]|uniref:uncharacterized protein LOC142985623 n=1 Tax=Anticarsia gemmatalis TaxID=129554 RepID=UPI003F7622C7
MCAPEVDPPVDGIVTLMDLLVEVEFALEYNEDTQYITDTDDEEDELVLKEDYYTDMATFHDYYTRMEAQLRTAERAAIAQTAETAQAYRTIEDADAARAAQTGVVRPLRAPPMFITGERALELDEAEFAMDNATTGEIIEELASSLPLRLVTALGLLRPSAAEQEAQAAESEAAPATEEPVAMETSTTETATTETPTMETTTMETSTTETSAMETSAMGTQIPEAPAPETPAVETPTVEQPAQEAGSQAPSADEPMAVETEQSGPIPRPPGLSTPEDKFLNMLKVYFTYKQLKRDLVESPAGLDENKQRLSEEYDAIIEFIEADIIMMGDLRQRIRI